MLKGIPKIISPDLMKVLLEMGHGDEIVLADGNFLLPLAGRSSFDVKVMGFLKYYRQFCNFFHSIRIVIILFR